MLQDALFLHVHLVDLSHLSLLRTRLLVQEPVCANHASLHASLFKPRIFTLLSRMRIFTRIYRYIYLCVYVCIHLNWMMVTWLRSWATLWPRHQGKIFGRPGKNVCIRDSDMYKWWFPVCPSPSVNFGMWVCARVHVQEISVMQFIQDIIRGFKRRTIESSLVSNGNYRQEKRTLYFHQKNGWVGWDTTFSHIWPIFKKLIDFSSSVFSLDNFQLSGEDGRGLWQKKLWCIQVSGCRSWLSWQKTCACWWSKKESSACDECLKVPSRQRWVFLCLFRGDPSLQEICTLKAVALSQFQLSNLWPFGKKKTKVREEKKTMVPSWPSAYLTTYTTCECTTWGFWWGI